MHSILIPDLKGNGQHRDQQNNLQNDPHKIFKGNEEIPDNDQCGQTVNEMESTDQHHNEGIIRIFVH